jgi:UDP-3-O-[3-hydroxymyristoyl] N-acetylglucosamine deacetylase/3-hydroxyacyl-[acyl-carrier-protein] dehydratase
VVDRKVEQDELDRLASVFNKNTVEVTQNGILNNLDLRFQNEPARHKLLDMIGDLFGDCFPLIPRFLGKVISLGLLRES